MGIGLGIRILTPSLKLMWFGYLPGDQFGGIADAKTYIYHEFIGGLIVSWSLSNR
jgi:hypothetical protein